jgi:hypothetical protein
MFTSQLFLKQCLRAAELKMKNVFDFRVLTDLGTTFALQLRTRIVIGHRRDPESADSRLR